MRKSIVVILLMFLTFSAKAQITLEQLQEQARANYPAIRKYGLVEQSRDFTLSNVAKGNLPQVLFQGKTSYQSSVTRLPIDVGKFGIDYEGLPRDQYNTSVTISQVIYDGGKIAAEKKIARAQADVQNEQINVMMYGIRESVNRLFFSILLIDEQLLHNILLQDDLRLVQKNVEAMITGGVANQSDADLVLVELIRARQQEEMLHTFRRTYLSMLSTFIGTPIDASLKLRKPTEALFPTVNNRPELSFYNAQQRLLDLQQSSLDVSLRPRVDIFLQGGVGNPGLNMFKNGWDAYYKVGATVSWNIGALYRRKNDTQLIDMERQQVNVNRETFLFNIRIQEQQLKGQIENIRSQIAHDDEIIRLRENIRRASEKRVESGIETVNEMLRDINAVSEARQQRAIHEVELLQEIHKLKTINNN
ncbi:TolC family protein [Prevotella koreensis]|uniref:TolC family protein n=1 Tax=Prevotella koreensis TaxID=2490854 RepID=UPI0028E5A76C|nr:TolC family protein [Prevotella koreensis]